MISKSCSLLFAATLMAAPMGAAFAQNTGSATSASPGTSTATTAPYGASTTTGTASAGTAGTGQGYQKVPPTANSSMASGHPTVPSNPYSAAAPAGGVGGGK